MTAPPVVSADQDGRRAKSRPLYVFSMTGDGDNAVLLKRVEQLGKVLERATKGVGATHVSSSKRGPVRVAHPFVVS